MALSFNADFLTLFISNIKWPALIAWTYILCLYIYTITMQRMRNFVKEGRCVGSTFTVEPQLNSFGRRKKFFIHDSSYEQLW